MASLLTRRLSQPEKLQSAAKRIAAAVVLIPFSDCHYFGGALNQHGYGIIGLGRKTSKAHRVAYELAHGPIPDHPSHHGMVVRHTCDEPSCVNPAHLVLGTQCDNLRDKVVRDRQYQGPRHHFRKLSGEAVRAIKAAYDRGECQSTVARRHGITQSYVYMIGTGRARRKAVAGGD